MKEEPAEQDRRGALRPGASIAPQGGIAKPRNLAAELT